MSLQKRTLEAFKLLGVGGAARRLVGRAGKRTCEKLTPPFAGSTAFKTFQPIIFQKALNVVYVLSGTRAGRGEVGEGEGRRRGGGVEKEGGREKRRD
ncbi:hypothetical protein GBAR_LOCUS31219 [Geodia barretti]|uniref:Uncharacterized protein n=1 Tax=Geodia barretti TaxID=519541 RepID=A0AA35U0Q0_GEOBA|nr:hypothetical protein GBAR_LOCUS31219 [Geodia barretti]